MRKKRKGREREYWTWSMMFQRCYNPNNPRYHDYGGRGITICERWKGDEGFENFWVDMGPKPTGYSIDRIDNNGSYEPCNCKWSTPSEQMSNRRNNRLLTYGDKTQTLAGWAKELGLQFLTLWSRLERGWTVERALSTPLTDMIPKFTMGGETKTLNEWAAIAGLKPKTIICRIRRGWSEEEALTKPLCQGSKTRGQGAGGQDWKVVLETGE